MMPGKTKRPLRLRAGMTGVKIPGRVGTWRVDAVIPATDPTGAAVLLFELRHSRIASAPRMLVTQTGDVIFGTIRTLDLKESLKQKGYQA